MKQLSLTWKLVLGGIAAVLIALGSMGTIQTIQQKTELENAVKELTQKTAQDIAEMVQITFLQEMNMAKEIAVGPNAVDTATKVAREGIESAAAQLAGLQRKLESAQKTVGENYEAIVVLGLDGITMADSVGGKLKGINTGERGYFKLAKQGQYNIGDIVKSKGSGKPIVPIAAPILTEQKEVVGVLAIILKLDSLLESIAKVKVGKTGYSYMVDQNGIVNAHPNQDLISKLDIKSEQGMKNIANAIMAGASGAAYYTYDGVEKIAGYAAVRITKWSVVATEPMNELRAPIRAMQLRMILLGFILLTAIAGCVFIFGRKISNPITRAVEGLSEASNQIASAAAQVSTSSQELAEGSSEQAASIEETSSSLEEMSSMNNRMRITPLMPIN